MYKYNDLRVEAYVRNIIFKWWMEDEGRGRGVLGTSMMTYIVLKGMGMDVRPKSVSFRCGRGRGPNFRLSCGNHKGITLNHLWKQFFLKKMAMGNIQGCRHFHKSFGHLISIKTVFATYLKFLKDPVTVYLKSLF